MKALTVMLAAIMTLAVLPADDAAAHERYRVYTNIGIGIGYGYPGFRPYRYYPRSYVGVSLWPRPLHRRAGTRERTRSVQTQQLYVYPAAGQTQQQLSNDRYDCHVWSVRQTNFDPTLGAGDRGQAEDYARAMTACLEARNYVVR